MAKRKSRMALIDGDMVIHQACNAAQAEVRWDDGLYTLHSDRNVVVGLIDRAIEKITEKTGAKTVLIALSCPIRRYWRHEILETYKEHRRANRPPLGMSEARDYVATTYEVDYRDELEADDVMGILATDPGWTKLEPVIVSQDKDFAQVPGLRYNPVTDKFDVSTVEQADRFHLFQTLVGDATDGYCGLPGCGPVKAEKILGDLTGRAAWDAVVEAYAKRLQIQEKMTAQIANTINDVLKPKGVAVVVEAAHQCMTTRGVHKPGVTMVTSRMLGAFRDDPSTRREVLAMIAAPRGGAEG